MVPLVHDVVFTGWVKHDRVGMMRLKWRATGRCVGKHEESGLEDVKGTSMHGDHSMPDDPQRQLCYAFR